MSYNAAKWGLSDTKDLNKTYDFINSFVDNPMYKKENWEKMVNEKELKGIELFEQNSEDDFFTDYVLQGIPRFIIIDKEGNIVDANAIRP